MVDGIEPGNGSRSPLGAGGVGARSSTRTASATSVRPATSTSTNSCTMRRRRVGTTGQRRRSLGHTVRPTAGAGRQVCRLPHESVELRRPAMRHHPDPRTLQRRCHRGLARQGRSPGAIPLDGLRSCIVVGSDAPHAAVRSIAATVSHPTHRWHRRDSVTPLRPSITGHVLVAAAKPTRRLSPTGEPSSPGLASSREWRELGVPASIPAGTRNARLP
jgi:hypothetical protein